MGDTGATDIKRTGIDALHIAASLVTLTNAAWALVGMAASVAPSPALPALQTDWSSWNWLLRTGLFFLLEYSLAIGFGWAIVAAHRGVVLKKVYGLYPMMMVLYVVTGIVTCYNLRVIIADPLTQSFTEAGGFFFTTQPNVDSGLLSILHLALAFWVGALWLAQHYKNHDWPKVDGSLSLMIGLQGVGFVVGAIVIHNVL